MVDPDPEQFAEAVLSFWSDRHGAGHPAITKPAGPVTGLTAVPGALRPGLAPASYSSYLFGKPARPQGHARAIGGGVVRRSEPASHRA
jgi:hypothetical protein